MSSTKPKKVVKECQICFGEVQPDYMVFLTSDSCDHLVCQPCLRAYFQAALKDDRHTTYNHIDCVVYECKGKYDSYEIVRNIFSASEVAAWWDAAISSRAYITNKVVCPMEGCEAVFDVDETFTKTCNFTECQECHRGFCLTCQTPWHPNVIKVFDDKEAEKKTLEEAKRCNWRQCPSCGHLVERTSGCNTMRCKCKNYFCYNCGQSKCNCTGNHPHMNINFSGTVNLPPDLFNPIDAPLLGLDPPQAFVPPPVVVPPPPLAPQAGILQPDFNPRRRIGVRPFPLQQVNVPRRTFSSRPGTSRRQDNSIWR